MKRKLEIELVPRPLWYLNLRKMISRSEWDKIRKKAYADYGHKCGICGANEKLYCHEVWDYNDKKHVQTLKGFIALCFACHMVKHIGFAGILAMDKSVEWDENPEQMAEKQYMKVNCVDRETFVNDKRKAFDKWAKRNLFEWKQDLSLVKRHD